MSVTGKRFSVNEQQPSNHQSGSDVSSNADRSSASPRPSAEQSYQVLRITGRTITLGNQIYQISNIARVGKYSVKPKYFFTLKSLVVLFFLGGVFLSQRELFFVGIIMLLLVATGCWERRRKKVKYALALESNGLTSGLFSSTNEQMVNRVIRAITEAMNSQNGNANYSFNIREGDVIAGDQINQSGVFETGIRN